MLATILGWFFIIMGILFVIWPQVLRNRLLKKSYKTMRRYFVLLSIFLGILLIKVSWGYEGLLPKIIVALGIIGIFKGFFLLKSKAAEKMSAWFAGQPLILFRAGAAFHILIGIAILNLS